MGAWEKEILEKIVNKVSITANRIQDSFPHISINGKFDNCSADWWTNGFWGGILWRMYAETKNEKFKKYAESIEEKMDGEIEYYLRLHHDVGFMWLPTAVANYKLTGNEKSRIRGLLVASHLASRFNLKGQFIRAWCDEPKIGDVRGYTIIDSMMNLPLLYWASQELNDPRFKYIAMAHADTVLKEFFREDGSSYHIVEFDIDTGKVKGYPNGQGMKPESIWTRGQAWAVYGFTLSYLYTGEKRYLDVAKRSAEAFLSKLDVSLIPPCDFCQAKDDKLYDSSAAVIVANGLIELGKALNESTYVEKARDILKSVEANYGVWSTDEEAIITNATIAYGGGHNVPVIYSDYYFIEAIIKLM